MVGGAENKSCEPYTFSISLYTNKSHEKSLSSSAGLPYTQEGSLTVLPNLSLHHDIQKKTDSIYPAHWGKQTSHNRGFCLTAPRASKSWAHLYTTVTHLECHDIPIPIETSALRCMLPHFNCFSRFLLYDKGLLPPIIKIITKIIQCVMWKDA